MIVQIPVINLESESIEGIVTAFYNSVIIGEGSVATISMSETTIVSITLDPFLSGIHPLLFTLYIPYDMDESNNSIVDSVFVSYIYGSAFINELLG